MCEPAWPPLLFTSFCHTLRSYVTQIHHVLPTAFLLWAIVFYRHPIVAGALVGAATGSLFFPAVTLPVWASFYWKRGARRFLGAVAVTAGVSLILTVALLWWDGRIGVVWQTISQPDWLPWRAPQNASEGFWGGIHWAYRIPVFIVYLSFLAATAFWPSPKNLAHLLALLAAVLLGIQFWYADQGRRLRLVVFADPVAGGVATELERPPAAHSRIGR